MSDRLSLNRLAAAVGAGVVLVTIAALIMSSAIRVSDAEPTGSPPSLTTATTPTPVARTSTPVPVRSPSIAPNGRTGDPAIDRLIDALLNSDAATLANAYRDLPAHQLRCDPDCLETTVSPAEWTSRLAAAGRALYAVFTGDTADVEVVLEVDVGNNSADAWRFSVESGRVVRVDIFGPQPVATGVLLHIGGGPPSFLLPPP